MDLGAGWEELFYSPCRVKRAQSALRAILRATQPFPALRKVRMYVADASVAE